MAIYAGGALSGKNITQISAGGALSLALSMDNKLFGWGTCNPTSSLQGLGAGDGVSVMRNAPVLVDMTSFGSKIVSSISAAADYALSLTSDGTVFGFGSNSNNQVRFIQTFNISTTILVFLDHSHQFLYKINL